MQKRDGFTLVELLVVIGIIAILIAVLLPALSRVRQQSISLKCSSNVRQLTAAALMFAGEHRGYIPPCSDTAFAKLNDPYRRNFTYRENNGIGDYLHDWASALLPYLGDRTLTDFQKAPTDKSRVFTCPGDCDLEINPPGHRIFNNVTNAVSNYQMISYGYNADITCLLNAAGQGKYANDSNTMNVFAGPKDPANRGKPLKALLSRVHKPSETLLFADCGTRSPTAFTGAPLANPEVVVYTTSFINGGTLLDISKDTVQNMGRKIPYTRHNRRIAIGFVDGHAEVLGQDQWRRVRVSPYRY